MTTNGGTSWAAVNSGLTDKRISQIWVMGNKLFAVTLKGVFLSVNNGSSWGAASSIPAGLVNCLLVVNDKIFAGTDSGVMRIPYSTTGVVKTDAVRPDHSKPRFSNNSGSMATVVFSLSAPEKVGLELYDLRGRQMLSLFYGKINAGSRSVSFNTGSIAPGSYVLRFKAGRTVYQRNVSIQR
jgi:hypothetical protein